jgi:TolB-like protein
MKTFYRSTISLLALALCILNVNAQVAEGKQTVALLEFEGRGISQLEAKTLTDRLMSEMVNTDAVIMVERNQMDEILNEQGFQQSGCTSSECAAEVGALLGVQNMVSGSFGKLGNSYTIDAKMFSVETGATIRTVSKTYKGPVDNLLTVIEVVGWEIVGLKAPQDKLDILAAADPALAASPKKSGGGKTLRRLMWTTLLLGGGAAAYLASTVEDPVPLPEPPVLPGGSN